MIDATTLATEDLEDLFGADDFMVSSLEDAGAERAEKAADEEAGEWVTIHGQHVLINSKGEIIRGNPKLVAEQQGMEFRPSARMMRAMANHAGGDLKAQRAADEQERIVSRALGLPRTRDNSAFDLNNGKIAVELKTMLSSKNGKITMSHAALARKNDEIKSARLKAYTVVADKRAGATKYYYAKGVGSFRVSSMTPVAIGELKGMLR